MSVEGITATLNISFVSNKEAWNIVDVNIETRDVTSLNGSAFGKTLLWLPANPENDEITNINGETAKISVSGNTETLQGAQRIFLVTNWSVSFNGFYDLDTGLLIEHGDWTREGTVRALGIRALDITRGLTETNIDLGPRELWPEIGRYFVFAPLIAVFIVVPVLILRRRQKRARIAKRLKNRKTASKRTLS